jgi:DNA end-binding protein Ku
VRGLCSQSAIDIDSFVPKKEIDQLYNIRPYYISPEGKVGIDAFAVIRDVIEQTDKVALGRVVLTSREHIIALEPRGKGLMGTLLRYPYEVRDESEYFDDIPAGHVTKEMIDIAKHVVQTKSGHFQPERFEDHYEEALKELLNKKQAGVEIKPAKAQKPTNVVNLMDALKRSVEAEGGRAPKRAAAQGKSTARKASHSRTKHRKAG